MIDATPEEDLYGDPSEVYATRPIVETRPNKSLKFRFEEGEPLTAALQIFSQHQGKVAFKVGSASLLSRRSSPTARRTT